VGISKRRASFVFGIALALECTGCARIGLREPQPVSERAVSTRVDHEQHIGKVNGSVEQEGTSVKVHVVKTCLQNDREMSKVERIQERQHFNETPLNDWYAGVGGGVSLALGLTMIAAPSTFGNSDATNPNGLSSKQVTGSGVALTALGVALLVIPVVDAVRASGAEQRTTVEWVRGPVVRRDIPCKGSPLSDAQLALATTPPVFLGGTDADGNAEVDLQRVVRDVAPARENVDVLLEGKPIGQIDLTPLAEMRENSEWTKVDTSGCASEASPEACGSLLLFLRLFPASQHVADADVALTAYRTKLKAEEAAAAAKAAAEEGARQVRLRAEQVAVQAKAAQEARAEQARKYEAESAERRRQAQATCRAKCESACNGDESCGHACFGQKCQ
jgi:hypothetical protein